jgi:hypothetical protein
MARNQSDLSIRQADDFHPTTKSRGISRVDERIVLSYNMRTPSKIEAAGGPVDTSKQQIEANSITWKRDYKGCMVTIFGSRSAGWNVQIDKREPIILGYTRPRAIKYARELIDEEQAKFHSRSAGGLPRNNKASPGSARHSFPTVISADRRRG